jgi:hypothetical protein
MTGIEGVGEAVTGGMAARAVEPAHGEAGEGAGACLNCGAELTGPYCHQCGQKAHVHRTISAWWHDFLHSVLHLDGKFWRTLPMLAWRPGELTRRYVEGERATFISPLALFLFSVFLMFGVFSAVGAPLIDPAGVERGMAEGVREADAQVAALERQRAAAAAAGRATADLDRRLESARQEASLLRTVSERGVEGASMRISDDLPPWAAWIEEPVRKANQNPALMLYKLQNNAYKFSWALIPISVPFLWLLMLHRGRYRREYKAYDHLVFVTYSIAFMSLLLIVVVLLRAIGISGGAVNLVFLLIPPIHIYRQLRGAYGLKWFSAAWRTAALLVFATFALIIFLMLLLAIGVLG